MLRCVAEKLGSYQEKMPSWCTACSLIQAFAEAVHVIHEPLVMQESNQILPIKKLCDMMSISNPYRELLQLVSVLKQSG